MKKLALLSTLLIAFCATVSSCKSHEKCPAYSKANTAVSPKNQCSYIHALAASN